LRPFFVKHMWDRNTFCIYHIKSDELQHGLNNMRDHSNHAKVCTDHVNDPSAPCNVIYNGTTSLWESIVCPKGDFEEWHKRECLYGECSHCGVGNLNFVLLKKVIWMVNL
jgi:hypothetical protein